METLPEISTLLGGIVNLTRLLVTCHPQDSSDLLASFPLTPQATWIAGCSPGCSRATCAGPVRALLPLPGALPQAPARPTLSVLALLSSLSPSRKLLNLSLVLGTHDLEFLFATVWQQLLWPV